MSLLTVLLSIVLVLNAAFLILLILIQLPKKEAGAGLAFGAGATDALFGAGSGNALTKVTKYTATVFLVLVVALSSLGQKIAHRGSSRLEMELKKRASIPAALPLPSASTSITNTLQPAALTNGNSLKLAQPTNAAAPAVVPAAPPPVAPPTTPPATLPPEPQK